MNVNIELMFEKTKKWSAELIRKKEQLTENKERIQLSIVQLDAEKNKDLLITVKEVDRFLNDIFKVLLPGTSAHLL